MSYDLEVYGARELEVNALPLLVQSAGGTAESFATQTWIKRSVRGASDNTLSIDGPLRVEREDLPEVVAERAVGVRVLYQLSVPTSSRAAVSLATEIAQSVADLVDGVLYDPQRSRVIWPRGAKRRLQLPKTNRVDVLKLHWYVSRQELKQHLAANVLDVIARRLPEALPRRFGNYEPLQHRLDESGHDGFVQFWRDEKMSMFWKGTLPCFGGYATGLGDSVIGTTVGSIHLDFDCRITADERWREELIRLFVELAMTTDCLYAHSVVERDWIVHGANLSCTADQIETFPPGLTDRSRWLGLPPYPTWLAWYGLAYTPLVRPHVIDDSIEVDNCLLWRAGELPADERVPPIPVDLMMQGIGRENRGRADRVPTGL
jgi:hypothetical protein